MSDFRIESLDRDDNSYQIHPPDNRKIILPKPYYPDDLEEDLTHACFVMFPPVFCKKGKKYRLIANQWAYNYIRNNNKIRKFQAIVIDDISKNQSAISYIQKMDDIMMTWLSGTYKSSKKRKRSGTREKAKKMGRLCPFCDGMLAEFTDPQAKGKDNKNCIIACENRNSPASRCRFTEELTEYEYDNFGAFKLKTGSWIKRLRGKTCKICGDDLYQRTYIDSSNERRTKDYCRKHFINHLPLYSNDEFKTQQLKDKGKQPIKRLCKAMTYRLGPMDVPAKLTGIAWLNKVLAFSGLHGMVGKADLIIPEFAAPLVSKTAQSRIHLVHAFHDDDEDLMTLNRMLIEANFPESPRLYLEDGSICKE